MFVTAFGFVSKLVWLSSGETTLVYPRIIRSVSDRPHTAIDRTREVTL